MISFDIDLTISEFRVNFRVSNVTVLDKTDRIDSTLLFTVNMTISADTILGRQQSINQSTPYEDGYRFVTVHTHDNFYSAPQLAK